MPRPGAPASDRWTASYGDPLRLAATPAATTSRRPGTAGVGTAPSVGLLADVGAPALHEHALGLANAFRAGVGLEVGGSAIVSVDLCRAAEDRVAAAGIVAAMRAGRLRLSFHVNNDDRDLACALDALSGWVKT